MFAVLQTGPWHAIVLQKTHHATQVGAGQGYGEGAKLSEAPMRCHPTFQHLARFRSVDQQLALTSTALGAGVYSLRLDKEAGVA